MGERVSFQINAHHTLLKPHFAALNGPNKCNKEILSRALKPDYREDHFQQHSSSHSLWGSGKHKPKDQKKKSNKQRLHFRAQNHHSDHLASLRASKD
ncbi:R-spondin-2 [Tachysurus ichikawai]